MASQRLMFGQSLWGKPEPEPEAQRVVLATQVSGDFEEAL